MLVFPNALTRLHQLQVLYSFFLLLCLFIFGYPGSSLLWGLFSSCGTQTSHHGGFLVAERGLQSTWASVVVARGLSSCSSRALEHRLSSCGTWAQLLHGTWDLPGPGIKPVSSALASGFFTTEPPGKPYFSYFRALSCVAAIDY